MTRARLGLVVALAVALWVAALSVGCWHATHPDTHRMLRLPLPGPAATAAGAEVGPSGTTSARVRRTLISVDPGHVHAAVPHRPPSREHPRGTLVLAGWKELFEIDIETGSLVRRTENPADDNYFSLVRTTSGLALAWDALDSQIAFLDHDLRVQAVRSLGNRSAVGMAADGDDLIVASALGGTLEETYELVRMDASRAKRIASVRQPGRVRWMLEYPAQVVVHRNRIHLLVYQPRIEVRSFDMALTPSSTTPVEPASSPYPDVVPPKGFLTTAQNDLLLEVDGHPFIVSPRSRAAQPLPRPFAEAGLGENFATDAAGHVLLKSGYLAQRIGAPFERLVETIGEKQKWKISDLGDQLYVDTPVTALFWGGRGIIVTQFPEVSLHVIVPERS